MFLMFLFNTDLKKPNKPNNKP